METQTNPLCGLVRKSLPFIEVVAKRLFGEKTEVVWDDESDAVVTIDEPSGHRWLLMADDSYNPPKTWMVQCQVFIPGHFNPYDGGSPPDVKETHIGEFRTYQEALLAMKMVALREEIDNVLDDLQMQTGWMP